MRLAINAESQLTVDDKPFPVGKLRHEVESFVKRVGKRHLVTVNVDPQASYDSYFAMQQELVAAYRDLREQTALRLFGNHYAALSQAQRDKVKDDCPQRIAEQYNGKGGEQ